MCTSVCLCVCFCMLGYSLISTNRSTPAMTARTWGGGGGSQMILNVVLLESFCLVSVCKYTKGSC